MNSVKKILLTGGAGYIGSQICFELLKEPKKYQPIIVDNLSNSSPDGINRIAKHYDCEIDFYQVDIRNREKLLKVFKTHSIDAVIHLAGLKSVKESIEHPVDYYCNNVRGSRIIIDCMHITGVRNLIFSSSACVYGEAKLIDGGLTEESPVGPINPYGQSKLIVENLLKRESRKNWGGNFISLRYFNPIGADPSGLIGENPRGTPENLLPYILKVAAGDLPILDVYGNDYPTRDGTAIRDYLHIVDLAQAHILALEYLLENPGQKYNVINLGTGTGYSVLEVISAFEKIGVQIPYQFVGRRAGDAAEIYANPRKAKEVLNWEAKLGLSDMVQDAWKN